MCRNRPGQTKAERPEPNQATTAPQSRVGKWKKYLIGTAVALLLLILWAPLLVQAKAMVLGGLRQSQALEPLELDRQSSLFGWLGPLSLTGQAIQDREERTLASVGSIDNELSLWRLLTQRRDLGKVTINQFDVTIEVSWGTTNIKKLIQEFVAKHATSETKESSSPVKVTIAIQNSELHALVTLTQEGWDLELREVTSQRDGEVVSLPKVAAAGKLLQRPLASGIAGQLVIHAHAVATLSPASDGGPPEALRWEIKAELQTPPLMWISLLKRHLPELPIDSGAGWVRMKAQSLIEAIEHWKVGVTEGVLAKVRQAAPQLIGPQAASILHVRWSGGWELVGKGSYVVDSQLSCDFGEASGTASLPWPLIPSAVTSPWIAGGEFDLRNLVPWAVLVLCGLVVVYIGKGIVFLILLFCLVD